MVFQPSIQNKVRAGYYVCIILIISVAFINYFNLNRADRKISFSFVISELFDTALEMRRFEKNYFLYKDVADYSENLRLTEKAKDIIRKNKDAIKKLSIAADVYSLEADIADYNSLMREYFGLDRKQYPSEASGLDLRIREIGKKIVSATESISTAERKYIQSLIITSRGILIGSIAFLVIAGLLIGQYLSKMVVMPLKKLERGMQSIANGNFNKCDMLSAGSSDREIVSLGNACSRMIKELEMKQMKVIIQSEKLISLGTMVSGIAHQLNNPLSNISTSCQILQEEVETPDIEYKKELLGQIEGQVDRAKIIVHSLLEFSSKKDFKRKPLSLRELVSDTISLLKGDIPSNIEIRTDIREDSWITADKHRIQQALLNIVKNSIDAMPGEGGIVISAKENTSSCFIEINIQDTGTGIESENLDRIFEPFFTTKDEGKGSGLGLFVAREIIEEHGGAIDVSSISGEGTTFSIKLPLKDSRDYGN